MRVAKWMNTVGRKIKGVSFFGFFLFALTCLFIKEAFALTCFPPIPNTFDIIQAPVIFNGRVIDFIEHKDDDGKVVYKDIRFKVNKMYKGPVSDTIDIRSILMMGYPPNLAIGLELTMIPDVMKDGTLGISYCSSGLRNQRFWESKVIEAYSRPVPMLYLLWVEYKYFLIGGIFLGLPFLLLVFCFVRRAIKNRKINNGSTS